MVKIEVISCPKPTDPDKPQLNVCGAVLSTQGRSPVEVFENLIHFDWEWRIDFSDAAEEECLTWAQADIIARVIRAKKKNKTIIMDGRPIRYFDADREVFQLLGYGRDAPEVVTDDGSFLVISCAKHREVAPIEVAVPVLAVLDAVS